MSSWLPPPADLGFDPVKFPDWRVDQPPALKAVLESERRFIGLVMPTGAGKSATYMAIPRLLDVRTVILTSTKALQDQLERDFGGLITILKGKAAYPCKALAPGGELASWNPTGERASCAEGPCHAGIRCSLKGSEKTNEPATCDYFRAVADAKDAEILVTNYACYLAHRIHAEGLGGIHVLVLDEAHAAPDELASALRVEIAATDLKAIGAPPWPTADYQTKGGWATLVAWASSLNKDLRRKLDTRKPESASEARLYLRMKRIENALSQLMAADPGMTLVREAYGKLSVDPIWAGAYSHLLFAEIKKVICTSATVTAKTLELVGVTLPQTTWFESQGSFDVRRRPVYIFHSDPPIRVDAHMTASTRQQWLSRIDDIIRSRPGVKGIIHTVSYERRNEILQHSAYRSRMLSHDKHDTAQQAARFKASQEPLVFVSPSMTTGYDFPHDECRFQIITKVPFPDTRDPITARRTIMDPDYGAYIAMQQFMQMAGRGMRAPDDWCETFVIDDHARWFVPKFKKYARRWFLNAVTYLDVIPRAPAWVPVINPKEQVDD